jgi:HEAT repeat protein
VRFHPPPPISVEAARRDLQSGKLEVRLRAAEGLGKAQGEQRPEAIDALREALADAAEDLRFAAALALGELGACEALDELLTLLEDPSPLARQGAAVALGQLGALLGPEDHGQRGRIASALRIAVDDSSADVRFQLPAALAQVDAAGAAPMLSRLLDDDDTEVRASAAAALGDVLVGPASDGNDDDGDNDDDGGSDSETDEANAAQEALAERLGDAPSVALEAAIALSRLGDGRGSEALVTHLADRDRALLAAERLFRSPPPATRAALAHHVGRLLIEPAVRVYLAGALAKLDDARGRERLEKALFGRNEIACGLAIELCGQLGGSWARGQLEALRGHKRGASWRDEIASALEQLGRLEGEQGER